MIRIMAVILVVLLGFISTQLVSSFTKKKRKIAYFVCIVYALGVLYFTLFSRQPTGNNRVNFMLFYSIIRSLKFPVHLDDYIHYLLSGQYDKVFTTTKPLETALLNILLFIPMGYLLPILLDANKGKLKVIMVCSAVCSLCIEIIQTITSLGWFDIDDLFCNVVGSIIGFLMYRIAIYMKQIRRK